MWFYDKKFLNVIDEIRQTALDVVEGCLCDALIILLLQIDQLVIKLDIAIKIIAYILAELTVSCTLLCISETQTDSHLYLRHHSIS